MRLWCLLISALLALILGQPLIIPYNFQDGQRVRVRLQQKKACVYLYGQNISISIIDRLYIDTETGIVDVYNGTCLGSAPERNKEAEFLIYDNGTHWLYSSPSFTCAALRYNRLHNVDSIHIGACNVTIPHNVSLIEVCNP